MTESLAEVLWPLETLHPVHLRGIDTTRHPWSIQPDIHSAHHEWTRYCAGTCAECAAPAQTQRHTVPEVRPVCAGPLDHRVIVDPPHHTKENDALARHHVPGQHYLVLGPRPTDTSIVGNAFTTTSPPLRNGINQSGTEAIIPLLAVAQSRTMANINRRLVNDLEHYWKIRLQARLLWTYSLAVLSDPATPERIPLTADPDLARRAIRLGSAIDAIHCSHIAPGAARWLTPLRTPIRKPVSIHYDHSTSTLQIGSRHALAHIASHVRNARIGPTPIIDRWIAGHADPERYELPLTPSEARARAVRQCENLLRMIWRLQAWTHLTAHCMQLCDEIYTRKLILPFDDDDRPDTR